MKDELTTNADAGQVAPPDAKLPVSGSFPSVWTCEHGKKCKWPIFHGFPRWGRPEHSTYEWRKYHEKECGGSLVILFEGNDR